jgi:hypothetical protein
MDTTGEPMWNFRLIHRVDETGDELAIHEAYYPEGQATPTSITEEAARVAAEDLPGLRRLMSRIQDAFDKPVLEYAEFHTAEKT